MLKKSEKRTFPHAPLENHSKGHGDVPIFINYFKMMKWGFLFWVANHPLENKGFNEIRSKPVAAGQGEKHFFSTLLSSL